MKTALVTGAAGFIGYHLSLRLLDAGWRVIGLDSLNAYYDPALKQHRLDQLMAHEAFVPVHGKLEQPGLLLDLFAEHRPDLVIHLAAQAGVRHSIEAPRDYLEANLIGTYELIEAARAYPPAHMLMASTSSVYGANTQMPYRETDKVDTIARGLGRDGHAAAIGVAAPDPGDGGGRIKKPFTQPLAEIVDALDGILFGQHRQPHHRRHRLGRQRIGQLHHAHQVDLITGDHRGVRQSRQVGGPAAHRRETAAQDHLHRRGQKLISVQERLGLGPERRKDHGKRLKMGPVRA